MNENFEDILSMVHASGKKKRLFLPHALRQMSRPDCMITTVEVRSVIEQGEIIEDYPDDPRGRSCLMFGRGEGRRPLHVVCSPKEDYLAIITAYLPNLRGWTEGFKKRVKL